MKIEEIRKNAPKCASHYIIDNENTHYYKYPSAWWDGYRWIFFKTPLDAKPLY